MGSDATRMCELLVGLGEVRVLAVTDDTGLVVTIETAQDQGWCRSCGLRATVKDRPRVLLGDLACFGRPATLVWRKRRWSCPTGCGGWTERNDAIAAPRCALTRRAGLWATDQVGRLARPVSQVAAELGVAWHTVMDAVVVYGTKLAAGPARIDGVEAIGVDEAKWLAAKAKAPTRWASAVVDVKAPRVLDMVEGRNADDIGTWLAARTPAWRQAVKVATCGLHEPFRAAFDEHLPDATQVADPFHVVAVGTRVIDRARRRVQNETLGHRGRKPGPLYRARKLLTLADERLDEKGRSKLRGLLAAGDPHGQVAAAHNAKECLREIYTLWARPDVARRWLNALITDLAGQPGTELRGMARTLRRWRGQILAWHTTGVSNGPTEGMILWSGQRRVVDVVHEGDGGRGGRVLWSPSLGCTLLRAG